MRRARIKAVATVPVRRKVTQDAPMTEPAAQTDAKVSEKPLEVKVESTVDTAPPPNTQSATIIKESAPPPSEESTILIKESAPPSSTESTAITKESASPLSTECKTLTATAPPTLAESTLSDVDSITAVKSNPPLINQQAKEKIETPDTLEKPLEKIPASPIRESPIRESPLLSEARTPKKIMLNQSKAMPCFMRPTPRLDGGGRIRRNSVQGSGASASESEDDSRRSTSIVSNRVRNDSVCSVQSLKDNSNTSNITKLKRRMVMSESARKLAKARREFLIKHENKSPDKSKLTMYDLIYYNPTTNPMKPKPTQRSNIRKVSVCSLPDTKKEEEEEEEEVADEPAEMLVPQVKVGPNGQLIIDEQSLVIDQYKAQENIDRSDIVVDEDTTGSGFYKRRQKSKEWTKWDTVKFYKALNTYGTDFLLMQSIFPKRTRQELKLKYKKEERLNQGLVEKALQYQEFDTEALDKDLANFEERRKKELESSKAKKKEASTSIDIKKRKRCRALTDTFTDNDEQNTKSNRKSCDDQSSDENTKITIISKKVKTSPARNRKAARLIDNSCDESGKDNSESEPEVYKAKPTRSGRSIKKNKKSQDKTKVCEVENKTLQKKTVEINGSDNNNDKGVDKTATHNSENIETSNNLERIDAVEFANERIINENKAAEVQNDKETENQNELLEVLGASSNIVSDVFDGITDDIPNMTNLQPGSLIVLKKDNADEPGKASLQVYVVNANYDANNPNYKDSLMPIDLTPDMLETVTNCIKNIEPQNVS